MNKSLLIITASLAAAAPAFAGSTPTFVPDCYAAGISPNGRWGVSAINGALSIINLETNTVYAGEGVPGVGTCINDQGIFVGSTPEDQGLICINGVFRNFDAATAEQYGLYWLQGINAEGTLVAGVVTNPEKDTEITNVPALWELNADYTVKNITFLPYPHLDFTGRPPQSISVSAFSTEATRIVGQLVDYSGAYVQPIVYEKGENGEWTFSLPFSELINPEHFEFPEDPGDGPVPPNPEDFMSDENLADYNEALERYYMTYDPEEYPDVVDYLEPDQIEAYNDAVKEYNEEALIFNEKFDAFYSVFEQLNAVATKFIRNNFFISPDGKTLAAGSEDLLFNPDTWEEKEIRVTVMYDFESKTITKLPAANNVYPSQLLDDGIVLGVNATAMGGTPPEAFIKLPANDDYIPLQDYIKTVNTEAYDWMMENLSKEIQLYDFGTYEFYTVDAFFSGLPFASADLSTIFAGIMTFYWPEEEDPSESGYTSYVIRNGESGIRNVVTGADGLCVSAVRGGELRLAGDAVSVEVYDLAGRLLFSAPAATTVNTGLASGAYIVRVNTATGSKAIKVNF